MKWFLIPCLLWVVAVSAAPDLLGTLIDPVKSAAEAVPVAPAPPAVEEKEHAAEEKEHAAEVKKLVETHQGTTADRTRLLSTLFTDYNSKVNPDNVVLRFGATLLDFHVCDERDVLESYVWLKYEWEDHRLHWTPAEYGGADLIRIPASEVWKPDVTVYNSADPVNMVNCWDSNVLVYSTGKIMWVPPCKMTTHCHYTLYKEPYGEQTCTLKFGSWTFDGNILNIQLYNQTNPGLDLSELHETTEFEVLSTTAVRHDKFYSCCAEPYPDITFNMTIKRIPGEELFTRM